MDDGPPGRAHRFFGAAVVGRAIRAQGEGGGEKMKRDEWSGEWMGRRVRWGGGGGDLLSDVTIVNGR